MPIRAVITDGHGTNHKLKINGEGELTATIHTHPPTDEKISSLPFRTYFKNSSGSSDMLVNGSTTAVPFYIEADDDYDYFIKTISVKLADAGAVFNKFGNITALTNGVEFKWTNQEVGDLIIHEGIQQNIQFFRLTNQIPTITDLSGGGADSIIVDIDLTRLFGLSWGIRLVKGSTDKLVFTVKDNLTAATGLDEFNIIGYGIKI